MSLSLKRTIRSFCLLGVAAILLVLLAASAFAQAAQGVPAYALDLKPILADALQGIGVILTILVSWAVSRLAAWLKLKNDGEIRAYLDAAIFHGINFAAARVEAGDTPAQISEEAAAYVAAHVPDALNHLGVTHEALSRMVLARMPPADPLTPPVTPTPAAS